MQWDNSVVIDAPAEVVWGLNVDVERWPTMTPTMQKVERLEPGPLGPGSTARVKQPGQSAAVWTVTHFVDGREFAWQTKRLGMTMEGRHVVEPLDGQRCRCTLSVAVTGFGSGLFGALIGSAITKAIRLENEGFRKAAAG
jgi:uncharacterized membrane protein